MSSASPYRRPPAACTIVSRNYLSHARVLARSWAEHVPGAPFYLFVIDDLPDGVGPGAPATLLGPEDLGIANFHELCFEYDVSELCTSVKPSLLLLMLDRFQEEQVIYFDPDIMIARPLQELWKPLGEASIVLTPNLLRPIPIDGLRPNEQDILVAGAFNLGFVGVRRSEEGYEFLQWWEERLLNGGAVVDVPRGLMTDQKWCDLVPGLFSETAILRDDTYNAAWWNLHHRVVSREGDRFLVNGRPLSFFHFSGFDPGRPELLTRENQNRMKLIPGTALADLYALYTRLHLENGYHETSKWGCGFARLDNGVYVNLPLRRAYLDLDEEARKRFGNPFRTEGPDAFLSWATTPQPEEANLSPFLLSLYQMRFDLWDAFPDVMGADRQAFLHWARTDGAAQVKYDPEQMHIGEALHGTGESNGSAGVAARVHGLPSTAAASALTRVPPRHVRRYRQVIVKVRDAVRRSVPEGATVLVVSKGDDDLLKLAGREAWHFPRGDDGGYPGYKPTDSQEAIQHLEALRDQGGQYLLFPSTALWWLDHYGDFRQHLERNYRVAFSREDTCMIFELSGKG